MSGIRIIRNGKTVEETKLDPTKPSTIHLTEKELQVLRWLADGQSQQFISAELGIMRSVTTQRIHQISRKLGTKTGKASAVVAKALRMGIIV